MTDVREDAETGDLVGGVFESSCRAVANTAATVGFCS